MIRVDEREGVCFIEVKVQPRASCNEIVGEWNRACKIKLTAAPAEGKANRALIELLSKRLGVPKSSLKIVRGEASRLKLVSVAGISGRSVQELLERL